MDLIDELKQNQKMERHGVSRFRPPMQVVALCSTFDGITTITTMDLLAKLQTRDPNQGPIHMLLTSDPQVDADPIW
jgi:hypothetical protein